MITVVTETGSKYEFNDDYSEVRRVGTHDMRRDGDLMPCSLIKVPTVGETIIMQLPPLSPEADVTYRTTSTVAEIYTSR